MAVYATALINLAAGLVIASWPERQEDLATMYRWGREWLEAYPIYFSDVDPPDYPPHAIIGLSWLSVLPFPVAVWTWAGVNALLAPIAAVLAVRAAHPRPLTRQTRLAVALLLCWGGFRTFLQFSLLAVVFGLASNVLVRQRPGASALLLGWSAMKPQIALPFVAALLFRARHAVLLVAAAVPAAGVLIYCLHVGTTPFAWMLRYLEILSMFYTGEAIMLGLAQLRPLVMLAFDDPRAVDLVSGAVALALLATITAVLGTLPSKQRAPFAGSLLGIWSLLTFHHLTNGFLVLLPTATLLMFLNDPQSRLYRWRLFIVLQLGLTFDVVTLSRWLRPSEGRFAVVTGWILHTDRVLMIGLFVAICVLALGVARRSSGELALSGVRG